MKLKELQFQVFPEIKGKKNIELANILITTLILLKYFHKIHFLKQSSE